MSAIPRLRPSFALQQNFAMCPTTDVGGNAWLKPDSETMDLTTRVNLRDDGLRLSIELKPTDHPLALEQRNGISIDRVAEIYSIMVHGADH